MLYEGCTSKELQAFIDLEDEYFDFGEGRMCVCNGEKDCYKRALLNRCWLEECNSNNNNQRIRQKTRLNHYARKQIDKKKIEKLDGTKWWLVNNVKPYKRRDYFGKRRKHIKRVSNRKVRQYKEDISDGGYYRKIYDYWWELI